jgi:hypothetical protein
MTRMPSHRLRPGLRGFALAALRVFGLGAAVHVGHHLLDPGCGSERGGESHPCVCSSLHGSALVEHVRAPEPWQIASFRPHPPRAETFTPLRAGVPASPRAPPLS